MEQYQFVGVDIAKGKFDVALNNGTREQHKQFDQTPLGFKAFLQWLKQQVQAPWVCMEATGHYSERLAEYLVGEGIKVSIVNPRQIKDFARAKMTRNKNDALDARV